MYERLEQHNCQNGNISCSVMRFKWNDSAARERKVPAFSSKCGLFINYRRTKIHIRIFCVRLKECHRTFQFVSVSFFALHFHHEWRRFIGACKFHSFSMGNERENESDFSKSWWCMASEAASMLPSPSPPMELRASFSVSTIVININELRKKSLPTII